jgi:hypothetical protein
MKYLTEYESRFYLNGLLNTFLICLFFTYWFKSIHPLQFLFGYSVGVLILVIFKTKCIKEVKQNENR